MPRARTGMFTDHFAGRVAPEALRGFLRAAGARLGAEADWDRLRGTLAYRAADHPLAERELRRFVVRGQGRPRWQEARIMLASTLAILGREPEAVALVREVLRDRALSNEERAQAQKLLDALRR